MFMDLKATHWAPGQEHPSHWPKRLPSSDTKKMMWRTLIGLHPESKCFFLLLSLKTTNTGVAMSDSLGADLRRQTHHITGTQTSTLQTRHGQPASTACSVLGKFAGQPATMLLTCNKGQGMWLHPTQPRGFHRKPCWPRWEQRIQGPLCSQTPWCGISSY